MRYVFALLLAVFYTMPAFAQMEMAVDNCCQTGRACETDAEWVQGYYDYHNDMCGDSMMSDDMGMMDDKMGMADDEMGMADDEMGMADDEMGMADDEMGMADDEMGMADDEMGMMDDGMGMMSDDMGMMIGDAFTFTGNGKTKTARFTLSPGKWRIKSDLMSTDLQWHAISQVDAMGEMAEGQRCLVWPINIPGRGLHVASTYSLWFSTPTYGGHVLAVRYPCDVVLEVFRFNTVYTAGQEAWKFFVQKVDGNL